MAAPSVLSTRTTEVTSNSSTHTVNMPATVNSGDQLIWFACVNANVSDGVQITSAPSGWSLIYTDEGSDSFGQGQFYVFTRTADGTEGGTTKSVSLVVRAALGEHFVVRLDSTADLANIEFGTPGYKTFNTNPTAPSITGVVDDRLFSVFAGYENGEAGGSTPSGFTLVDRQSAGGSGPTLAVAHKSVTSAGATGTSSWGTLTYGASYVALHIRVPVASAGSQTLSPTGFADSDAFGAPKINLNISATGYANSDAFGAAEIDLKVYASGFADSDAFGSPQINLSLSATGFSDADSFGTPQIDLKIYSTGFANAQSFGSASIEHLQSLVAAALVNAQAFGAAKINFKIYGAGFSNDQAFGEPTTEHGLIITFNYDIADDDQFGSPTILSSYVVEVEAPVDVDYFGSPTITETLYLKAKAIINRSRGFGQPVITGGEAPTPIGPPTADDLKKYIPSPQPVDPVSDRQYLESELKKIQVSIGLIVEETQG